MDYSKSRYSFQSTSSSRSSSSSSCSVSQARQLAYQIGTMSRSKIQKEAAKTVPQLHRLVCHAAVYDNAAKFIIDHMHDYSPAIEQSPLLETIEEIEDVDDDFTLDGIVDIVPEDEDSLEPIDTSLQTAQVASFNGYAQLKSPRLCGVVVTTTVVGARDSHWEDVESDSSSGTDESDNDDEFDFDDQYDYDYHHGYGYGYTGGDHYRQYEKQSDRNYARSCSKEYGYATSTTPSYSYSYSYSNHRSDDDQLLWSQQPRVWSQQQEAHLFVEAFG